MKEKVLIISHSSLIEGPIDYYCDFLKRNKLNYLRLDHPLDKYQGRVTTLHNSAEDTTEIIQNRKSYLLIFNYIIDFIISLYVLIKHQPSIIIGSNNFDTLPAIAYKKLLFDINVRIIYFASDYSEDRFKVNVLNKVYMTVEQIVLSQSNLVVSNTKRAQDKRLTLGLKKQQGIVIPNGVYIKSYKAQIKQIDKHTFIYVGSVTAEHGLFEVLRSIKQIMHNLTIIGYGPELDAVEKYCRDNNVSIKIIKNISHDKVLNYLKDFKGIGLAPYTQASKWTTYCSPLKVSEYIANGIPVVISNVPEIAEYVKKEKLGIVFNSSTSKKLPAEILRFNTDGFSTKAYDFYQHFSAENLYKMIEISK